MWNLRSLWKRKAASPQPFSWAPSNWFEGSDGSWSTFIVRIGTPPQTFRVLPSTLGQETWVPAPEECVVFVNKTAEECGNLRGAQAFQNAPSSGFMVNESFTWDLIGLYKLGLEGNLNYTGNGKYGFETIGLELQNSGGPTLQHQVVAGTASKDFMLGVFGLGPKPTNFSDFNEPQPSYISSLKNQSIIPSLSYGYSAGAQYKGKGVLGSLTLGGYDVARFTPNNLTFTFGPDTSAPLMVGLQSIQGSNTLNGDISMLPKGGYYLIDSTVPEIWLPVDACAIFETSFGLVLDPNTDRYLVNDTIRTRLQSLHPSLTFKLGNENYGGESINIVLPYSAFDLQANYPIYQNETNYFPLRRAANDSQYVIGRTFLQESYLTVDHERQTFTISQSLFPANSTSKIVPIQPLTIDQAHSGLSHGALIGIIVAAVIGGLLVLAGGAFMLHKLKQKREKSRTVELEAEARPETKAEEADLQSPGAGTIEMHEDTLYEVHDKVMSPMLDSSPIREMDAGLVHEIEGTPIRSELSASTAVSRQWNF